MATVFSKLNPKQQREIGPPDRDRPGLAALRFKRVAFINRRRARAGRAPDAAVACLQPLR